MSICLSQQQQQHTHTHFTTYNFDFSSSEPHNDSVPYWGSFYPLIILVSFSEPQEILRLLTKSWHKSLTFC